MTTRKRSRGRVTVRSRRRKKEAEGGGSMMRRQVWFRARRGVEAVGG